MPNSYSWVEMDEPDGFSSTFEHFTLRRVLTRRNLDPLLRELRQGHPMESGRRPRTEGVSEISQRRRPPGEKKRPPRGSRD